MHLKKLIKSILPILFIGFSLTSCGLITTSYEETYVKFIDGIDYQTISTIKYSELDKTGFDDVLPIQTDHELYQWYSGKFYRNDSKANFDNLGSYISNHGPDETYKNLTQTSPHTALLEKQRIYYVFLRYREHLKPYKITYHLNGGHFERVTVFSTYCLMDIDYDFNNIKSKIMDPVKPTGTFSTWTDASGTPLEYMDITGDFELYAQWSDYTYYPGGDSEPSSSVHVTLEVPYYVDLGDLELPSTLDRSLGTYVLPDMPSGENGEYTFMGWSTQQYYLSAVNSIDLSTCSDYVHLYALYLEGAHEVHYYTDTGVLYHSNYYYYTDYLNGTYKLYPIPSGKANDPYNEYYWDQEVTEFRDYDLHLVSTPKVYYITVYYYIYQTSGYYYLSDKHGFSLQYYYGTTVGDLFDPEYYLQAGLNVKTVHFVGDMHETSYGSQYYQTYKAADPNILLGKNGSFNLTALLELV